MQGAKIIPASGRLRDGNFLTPPQPRGPFPPANGFSITTGISTLSCQMNGMDLNYSWTTEVSR